MDAVVVVLFADDGTVGANLRDAGIAVMGDDKRKYLRLRIDEGLDAFRQLVQTLFRDG